MERRTLGIVLVVGSLVGIALVFGVGAATAPSQDIDKETNARTLIGIQGGGVGYHRYGSVKLVDESGRQLWKIENADSYFDVTALDNGSVMAGFMDGGYDDCDPYDSPCTHTGFRILDPNASDPITFEYSYPVRTATNSETHDVERLPSGEYLVSDMENERIYTIRPDGTVTWQWRASSFYDAPEDPTRTDWLHLNDVDSLGDDRFLVSIRNANQLVIVHRDEGVVDVVNEAGTEELLNKQHNPQWLAENAILVADSDNNRIVELHRNGSDGEWFVAWGLREANGVEFEWPRDADRLANGNTLVTDSRNNRIVEVTENGTVVWSTTLERNQIPYEAERLPEGETVGAQVYNPEAGSIEIGDENTVPVLSSLLRLSQAAYPLPFWFGEWHLLGVLAGLVGVLSGSGLLVADRWGAQFRRRVTELR